MLDHGRTERSRIDHRPESCDLALDILGDKLQPVARADAERFAPNPKNLRAHAIRFDRRVDFVGSHMAALDEDMVAKCNADRFSRARELHGRCLAPPPDRRYLRCLVMRRENYLIADP